MRDLIAVVPGCKADRVLEHREHQVIFPSKTFVERSPRQPGFFEHRPDRQPIEPILFK